MGNACGSAGGAASGADGAGRTSDSAPFGSACSRGRAKDSPSRFADSTGDSAATSSRSGIAADAPLLKSLPVEPLCAWVALGHWLSKASCVGGALLPGSPKSAPGRGPSGAGNGTSAVALSCAALGGAERSSTPSDSALFLSAESGGVCAEEELAAPPIAASAAGSDAPLFSTGLAGAVAGVLAGCGNATPDDGAESFASSITVRSVTPTPSNITAAMDSGTRQRLNHDRGSAIAVDTGVRRDAVRIVESSAWLGFSVASSR